MQLDDYKVRSITWREGEADTFNAYDDEDAAEMWCKEMERNSNFVDGYPDNHELEVTAPDGIVTVVEVDTEFEPQYYCRTRGS
ncbi:MAG: hypothetical protein WBB98_04795 [Xanthobacteraceae bacterium]